jgi:hypothetical protein
MSLQDDHPARPASPDPQVYRCSSVGGALGSWANEGTRRLIGFNRCSVRELLGIGQARPVLTPNPKPRRMDGRANCAINPAQSALSNLAGAARHRPGETSFQPRPHTEVLSEAGALLGSYMSKPRLALCSDSESSSVQDSASELCTVQDLLGVRVTPRTNFSAAGFRGWRSADGVVRTSPCKLAF